MTGAAAVVSPEAPSKGLNEHIIHGNYNDNNDGEDDTLEYSLTTDEGSLKDSITSSIQVPPDNNKNKKKNETIKSVDVIEDDRSDTDIDVDTDNVIYDDNDGSDNERRRFLPIHTNKKPLSILKKKNKHNGNANANTNANTSNANRNMSIETKGRNIKNKEKAMCEYFNEEDNLDEGDLPSLQGKVVTPKNMNMNMNMNMNTNTNINMNGGNHRRVVSPTPSHASASTPVQDNTEIKSAKSKNKKKLKKNGFSNSNTNANMNTPTNNNNNKNHNVSMDSSRDVVTLSVPKLNSADKRKHRAFWDQFDAKHSDESDNENEKDNVHEYAPRDERVGLTSTSNSFSNSKFTPRKREVIQNDEEEEEDNNGIISMVVDMCSDCGWLGGDDSNTKSASAGASAGAGAGASNHKMKRRRSSKEMNSLITDTDVDTDVEVDADDDHTIARQNSGRKEDDSTVMTRESSFRREVSFRNRSDASHHTTETDEESTKHSGSRTTSGRKKRGDFPRQNSDYSSSSYVSMNQIESNSLKEPQNFEHTKIEVEYEEEEDSRFLQLNQDGDVALYKHPDDRKKGQEASIYEEPMPSDEQRYQTIGNTTDRSMSRENGGFLMSKSNSWSEPQKSAYLQAMAQKAKQDFNKRKGVVEQQQQQQQHQHPQSRNMNPTSPDRAKMRPQNNDEDSLNGILGENKARVEQAPKSTKAIDWTRHNWTPSEKRRLFHLVKSEGMTPEEATDILIAARPPNRRNLPTEQRIDDDGSQKVQEEVMKQRSTTPKTRMTIASEPASPSPRRNLEESNGQYPMDEAPASPPPTSRVQVVKDSSISPMKSVGSPGSVAARSKIAGSKILSNLRKRPGFSRVVDTNLQDQSDEQSHEEESVEISLEQTLDRSLPMGDHRVQSPGGKSVSKPSKKKKGSKSGRMWHHMDDNDDEYAGDGNVVSTAQNVRSIKDSNKRNEDIFDFESSEGTEGKTSAPLNALKLDPYHDSCDVSHLGSMMTNDHTIMSGNRSVYTTATNASSWSTSTRRRHRGAAKNRHEKNDKKQPVGWLDSIKAAAASNNREWDPQVGWVGYVEPTEDNNEVRDKQDVARIGKLKAPRLAKSIKDLRREAELAARVDESIKEEEDVPVPFPSEWEKERDEMVSVYKDDDGAASAITEVIKNRMGDNDSVDVASNADTEVVSNHVKNRSRIVYNSIPERIVEDSYYSDSDNGDDENDSSQGVNEIVEKQFQEIEEEYEDCQAKEIEDNVKKGIENNANKIISLQSEARGNLKEVVFSARADEVGYQGNVLIPKIKEDDHKTEMQSVSSPKSNHSASYYSIGPHSPGSVSRKSTSSDLVNEKQGTFNNNEASSDTAESSSDEEDGGEFDNGMSSFEFSDVGKIESTDDSGFKVIKSAPSSPVFKLSDIKILDDEGEEEAHNEDKSVTSTSSMMSQKAKKWREKVEIKKRSVSTQRQEILAEEPIHNHGNIFVSAADDNSTIEIRERPKILNVDEEDTLFDFGGVDEPAKPQPVNKNVEAPKNRERKQSSTRRRPRIEDDKTADDMSEITTPTVVVTKPEGTFLQRLHSCTVDAVGRCDDERQRGSGLPKAHLQFLRNSSTADVGGASKSKDNRAGGLINLLTSPGLCGRSESIEDSDDEKPRTKSKRANLASNYLEAIKTGKCNAEVRKTPSVHSSSSSVHSETWQRFLDKRAVALSSSRSSTGVSKAAQEYASKKVEEIVKKVNSEENNRRKPAFPLTRPPSSSNRSKMYTGRKPSSDEIMSKSDAVKAAEDLAAARVEAMMAMEPRTLSHDECEI